jgi:hypothetical protein
MTASRRAAALVCLALATVACPSAPDRISTEPASSVAVPSAAAGGAPTAAAAIRELCAAPAVQAGATSTPSPGPTPPEVAEIEHQVEEVRGLTYEHAVAVQAVSADEMKRRVVDLFDATYPAAYYDRRTAAWRTIGVIPPEADLRHALRSFLGGGVVGFYDPETGELVYEGSGELGLQERLVLAHELTHAIDDQYFDLSRLDRLAHRCDEEASAAALGAVEGNAQYVAVQTLASFPTGDIADMLDALLEGLEPQPDLADVPPFVQSLEIWPYTAGLAFITRRAMDGGTAAVDETLRHPPTTTEQVIHPERYPADQPSPVDVPDLSGDLGPGWGDLDAMTVGEEWLDAMLRLRMDPSSANEVSAGWDGGVYRAWADGSDVAVVMDTAWDTGEDAAAFAAAMTSWNDGNVATSVATDGTHVTLVFATNEDIRTRLDTALARA